MATMATSQVSAMAASSEKARQQAEVLASQTASQAQRVAEQQTSLKEALRASPGRASPGSRSSSSTSGSSVPRSARVAPSPPSRRATDTAERAAAASSALDRARANFAAGAPRRSPPPLALPISTLSSRAPTTAGALQLYPFQVAPGGAPQSQQQAHIDSAVAQLPGFTAIAPPAAAQPGDDARGSRTPTPEP
jgi:hypothetical protein